MLLSLCLPLALSYCLYPRRRSKVMSLEQYWSGKVEWKGLGRDALGMLAKSLCLDPGGPSNLLRARIENHLETPTGLRDNHHNIITEPGSCSTCHRAERALKDIRSDLQAMQRGQQRFRAQEYIRHQRLLQANVAALISQQREAQTRAEAALRGRGRGRQQQRLPFQLDSDASVTRRPVLSDILDDFDRRSQLPLPSEFNFDKVDAEIVPLAEARGLRIQAKMAVSDSMPINRVMKIMRRKPNDLEDRDRLRLLLGQLLEVESSSAVMRTLLSDEVPDLSASTCDISSVAFNGINHSSSPEEEPGGRETCCELSKTSGLSSQDGTCDADVKDHRTVRVDADESKDGQPFATGMNLVVMPKNESHFLGSDRDKFQDDVDALSSDDEELIKQFLRFKPSSDHRHSMRKMSR